MRIIMPQNCRLALMGVSPFAAFEVMISEETEPVKGSDEKTC